MPPSQSSGPRVVYGVSSGEYSDYGVDIIFESREDAEAYVADGGADRVEEFELWPAGAGPERVTVYRGGWTPGQEPWVRAERQDKDRTDLERYERAKVTENGWDIERWRQSGQVGSWSWWLTASGPTEESVMKALRDRIAVIRVREGLD